jgi:hypothetical protein
MTHFGLPRDIPKIYWVRHVEGFGERRGVYRVLVVKHEGNRPLGRTRRRWEDNIKMDSHEVGCGAWTASSWHRIEAGESKMQRIP